ncbi:MAG: RluA family pseudouridine synthase [Candidatus Sungbacteria bacterium]|uniref:Pseudouridine synthase n=1 Tax=Candidatus Sungiibacteriota bacterium TaxID=2750080 RepID=A0A932YWM3_9BACT|nr:RluA family pseudouridine synthase [Candidatus Sungbacteria bacterium]
MPIALIHEHADFLVLNKPAGIAVHRARLRDGQGVGIKGETVADWLMERYPEVKSVGDEPEVRPGIVHRLDQDTSGVMVAARNQKAFEDLKELFKTRQVQKKYLALVVGIPKHASGVIAVPVGRSVSNPTRRSVGKHVRGAKTAVTHYRILERLNGYSLLEVQPKTGRMHQIRVHLASIGHPVAGDRTYGGTKAALPGLARQFLHASSLEFSYPEGRRWHFETALPEDLARVLKDLRALRKRKSRDTM